MAPRGRKRSDESSVKRTRSVQRALQVLNVFEPGEPELELRRIAQRTGLSGATTYRLLLTLQEEGFLYQNPVTERYRLGMRLLYLGQLARDQNDIRAVALPHMRELRDETGESAHLNIISGLHRVCIEWLDSPHDLRNTTVLGRPYLLRTGASGKVLLAHESTDFVQQITREMGPESASGNSISDPDALLAELARIRANGYSITHGERIVGSTSISAPIRDSAGSVVASITISGPSIRFTAEKLPGMINAVKFAAYTISRHLGSREDQPLVPLSLSPLAPEGH
ncbi:MAG: transcriptional regulator, IclR family [Firmicutes bacterium]|nr:transcriptional regulator, IclR family [Bacillota bacterium]